jgi:hypothetical protein
MTALKPPPSPEPVAETFEAELKAINEKGKDLKGDQKVFYNSIVERVANNVQVLADLRAEHTALRAKLREVIKAKEEKPRRIDLAGDIRHSSHEVNLMRRQIDHIKRDRSDSVDRQQQLVIMQANFKQAEVYEHPEETLMANMRNELDRVNIKTEEARHLMKIYHSIAYQLDRQKMRYAPTDRNKQAEIAAKNRDIGDLTLVSRDSRYACTCAKNDYFRAKAVVHEASKQRRAELENKKAQVMADQQPFDADISKSPTKAAPSINAQPSVIRNKLNKAAREKREERFRTVSAIRESVHDAFETNDPDKIFAMFQERRHTNATLTKQIEDLKVECSELQALSDRLQSQLDEAEYASAKGVGGNRMISEGLAILAEKKAEKKKADRELEAVEQYQKAVVSGCYHLQDILALVEREEEQVEMAPHEILQKCQKKVDEVVAALENEDQEYLDVVNKIVFAQQKAKEDAVLEGDGQKKPGRPTIGKRQRDTKLEVVTRVLDRNAVKALAQKTLLLQAQSTKKIAKPK